MLRIFSLLLLGNFAINAMEKEKIIDDNNNNACPLIFPEEKKDTNIKCSACNNDPKSLLIAPFSGGASFGLSYYAVQKLSPKTIADDNFLFTVFPITLIIVYPVYYFTQSCIDYLNKIPGNQQCSTCSKTPLNKWNRGKNGGISLLGLFSISLLYKYLTY